MKPHKHSEVIKAWADGAEIQYLESNESWRDVKDPSWGSNNKYRVKPAPVIAWYRVAELDGKNGVVPNLTAFNDSEERAIINSPHFIRWLTDRIRYEVSK